ncbi:MAG TPA: hypothetical protein VFK56_09875 [Mycobacterium sp.]|nr:hypothetical protein [Mycobacterium sp.]
MTFGRGWSGGSDMRGERGAQSQAELSPSGTRVASENVGAPDGRGTTPGIGRAAMAQRLTIYIPVPRPSATGARTQSPFTTVVISVPTGSILRASGQPQPQPTPSPRLRIGEVPTDKPDVEVIDSSGQGGSDEAPANDSQPISAPVVIVPPLAAPPRPAPPSAPPVSPPVPGAAPPPAAGRPGGQVHAPTSIVAGAPPRMRERAPSPAPAPAPGAVPVDMPATRPGYRQYLRTAKTTDLAVVALPGLAGLVLMTVTGTIVGQRQARAAQMLRHSGAIRFMA